MVARATVAGAAIRRGSVRAWHATGRYIRAAGLAAAAAAVLAWDLGRRAVRAVTSGGRRVARRVSGFAATDARTVAGSAVAAGRRLRPQPETVPGGPDGVLPPRPDGAPGPEPAAALLPLLGGDSRGRSVPAAPDPDGAEPAGDVPEEQPVVPAAFVPAAPEAGPRGLTEVELGVLADAGMLDAATQAMPSVGTAAGTEVLTASRTDVLPEVEATPEARPEGPPQPESQPESVTEVMPAPSVWRRRPRDGVIVPLRVPLLVRLRAVAGLAVMVIVLGTTMAIIVAGLALAGVQALDRF
jgi:hypothetical protein